MFKSFEGVWPDGGGRELLSLREPSQLDCFKVQIQGARLQEKDPVGDVGVCVFQMLQARFG